MINRIVDTDNILIGSDPEFFLMKEDKIYPSIGIIEGTKYEPIVINNVSIFKDNVLVEGNIEPAKNSAEFIANMQGLKKTIASVSGGYIPISMDSFKFKPSQLKSMEAKEFGCSPYEKAWEAKLVKADNLSKSLSRSAGFHIHIGYEKTNNAIMKTELDKAIAKAYDYFCIFPSRLHHFDKFRSENYGDFGAYRNKPYGVEVRSLGGYFSQDEYLEWVYNQSIRAIEFVSSPINFRKLQVLTQPKFTNHEYQFLNINLNKQTI